MTETQTSTAPNGHDSPPPSAETTTSSTQEVTPPTRPEGLPDEFWDAGTGVKQDALLKAYTDLRTAADAKPEGVPESPADYELVIPEAYENAEQIREQLDGDSPFLEKARAFLHERGVSQEAFNELFAGYLTDRLGDPAAIEQRKADEATKLGEKSEDRVNAVAAWLNGAVGAKHYEVLRPFITSADAVEALEALQEATKDRVVPTPKPTPPDPHAGETPNQRHARALYGS